MAQLWPANPAATAAFKGAVRHHRCSQGPLQIVRQPTLVDAGIDVIPWQGLAAKGLQITAGKSFRRSPGAHFHGPIPAAQACRLDGPCPGPIGAIGRLKPGIQASTGPPGRLNHRRQAPVPAPHKVFHRRKPYVGEVGLDPPQLAQGRAQQLLAPLEFRRADAVPLERRVGLGREIADREVELQPAQVAALALQGPAGVGNPEHVLVGFPRQTNHEIELHLAVAAFHRGANAPEQVPIGEALVDDVAEPLGASLRGEGESRLAGATQDVGDVGVEAINPLTGQGEAHVFVGEAVAELHTHRRQGQVIGAAQGEQRKIGIAGFGHALLHRLNHRFGLHIPGRAGEHARLAKAATPGAAPPDLNREPVVDRFDVGHQTHGVVGHWRGRAPQDSFGWALDQRLQAHPIGAWGIERRHIHPRHLGQISQQGGARQPGRLGLRHHKANLRQQFLAIAEGDEIKEGRKGFGVAGGGGPPGENQRRCFGMVQRQVAPVPREQGHPGQIQHLEDVGAAELIAEAEAKDVEGRQGPATFHPKQGQVSLAQPGRKIRRRQVGPIAELARKAVEDRIENDVAGIAGPHLVDLWVGEGPTHPSTSPSNLPIAGFNPKLIAQIAGWFADAQINQGIEINRRGRISRGKRGKGHGRRGQALP